MPLSNIHQKVRTSTVSAYRRQQHQYICRHGQIGHVIPGHAILVAVCIFMLPMLEVAAEHEQLTTTHHTNPADLHGGYVTFSHSPLVLPSLDNMLPAMVLQNRILWSNIHQSHSLSHSSNCCVFLKLGLSVSYSLKVVGMVMVLLLLLSGDIETNPGPDGNKLILDDVGCVFEEVVDLSAQWYLLGIQLKVKIGTLDSIRTQFADPKHQLLEMLKAWLATSDNTTWKILTNALRSQSVGAGQLAGELEKKYCLVKKAEVGKEIPTQKDKKTTTGTYCAAAPAITSEIPTISTAPCSSNECTSPPPSEGSQKTPFGCGCGKCTLFSLIERGCPRPIPSASSFPYLDLSRLTHEQQQELRGRLQSESQQIMMQFQKLISATIKSLERQNVPPDKLLCHVMAMGSLKPVFEKPQVPALHHCYKELKAAKTVYESFLVLKDYFSFFNYHIIEHIIEELGTEDDKAKLQRYKEDFNQYAKRRIFECLPEFGPICDIDHVDVFVKVDLQYETYTVEEIEMFRHKLSEILRVSSQGILRLCRIDKGCFQLMFQVPSLVQQEIFPLSEKQEEGLAAMGVMKLTCGEYQFLKNTHTAHGIGPNLPNHSPLQSLVSGVVDTIVNPREVKPMMVAKYKCECGYKWKSKNSSGGTKSCNMCYKDVQPYKYRPAKEKELKKGPRRMFGEFYCEDCEHKWFSGNSWKGKGQQCKLCKKMVLPLYLRPLRRRFHAVEDRKPHEEALCQKCQELGHSCREYTPDESEQLADDDVSVFSESSSTTDSNVSEQDRDSEDLTPLPSDSELTDDPLQQLENLKL